MAESILHWGAVTVRVTGSGNLDMTLIGLDGTKNFPITPLAMSDSSGREPTKLTNFNSQRTKLKLTTNVINEIMRVNRIILWVKQRATQFPSGT